MDKNTSNDKIQRCDEIMALLDGMDGSELSNILDEFEIKVSIYATYI